MSEDIQHFLDKETNDPRPLIISGCEHGVTESWWQKMMLRDITGSVRYNIIARWVKPVHAPKMQSWRVISVELMVDEISRAVGLLIHHTKMGSFRERFGTDAMTWLQRTGYLSVREDPRCHNIHRIKEDRQNLYRDILKTADKRIPLWQIYPDLVTLFAKNDATFQANKAKFSGKNWKRKS